MRKRRPEPIKYFLIGYERGKDRPMNWYSFWGWVATGLSLSGNWLVIKLNPLGFILWTIANVILITRFTKSKDWSQVVLFLAYTAMNVVGILEWIKH